MIHSMKLQSDPFYKIKSGSKRVECRLFDEKRQKINVGDEIEFSLIDNKNEKINVLITNLKRFDNFYDMFKYYNARAIGFDKNSSDENAKLMEIYYTAEDIKKFGTLAIEIVPIQKGINPNGRQFNKNHKYFDFYDDIKQSVNGGDW